MRLRHARSVRHAPSSQPSGKRLVLCRSSALAALGKLPGIDEVVNDAPGLGKGLVPSGLLNVLGAVPLLERCHWFCSSPLRALSHRFRTAAPRAVRPPPTSGYPAPKAPSVLATANAFRQARHHLPSGQPST